MSGIPRTPSRWLALAGMIAVLPLAAVLLGLSELTADGGFDDSDPGAVATALHWQLVATVGATAAVVALVGLAAGMRAVAFLGSALVTGAAFILLLDASTTGDMATIPTLVVIAVGLTGCRAATLRTPDE